LKQFETNIYKRASKQKNLNKTKEIFKNKKRSGFYEICKEKV